MRALIGRVLSALVVYFRESPGSVSLFVSEFVLLLAHFGLSVSPTTLFQVGAVLVPIILGYFHVATRAQKRRAVEAAKAEVGRS
jgi:hypothetical protein